MKEQITFNFIRKKAFQRCLLPYWIYINGEYVGEIKNGKTLTVQVERKSAYIVSTQDCLNESRLIDTSAADEIHIEVVTGKSFGAHCDVIFFLLDKHGERHELPDPFEKIRNPYDDMDESALTEKERTLKLCLEFWLEYSDGLAEVLYNEKLNEMLHALEKMNAVSLLRVFNHAVDLHLSGVSLPLQDDEVGEATQRKIEQAEKTARNLDVNGKLGEEFNCDMVCYLMGVCPKVR